MEKIDAGIEYAINNLFLKSIFFISNIDAIG
jgi:hypothetical protein